MTEKQPVHVIRGGLAGSEAAWQLAKYDVPVVLHEMRPIVKTAAHETDGLAELQDDNGAYFDDDKIESFVQENENNSPDSFNEKLLAEIDKFRGGKEYSDDIAILTCKIYGPK